MSDAGQRMQTFLWQSAAVTVVLFLIIPLAFTPGCAPADDPRRERVEEPDEERFEELYRKRRYFNLYRDRETDQCFLITYEGGMLHWPCDKGDTDAVR